MGFFNDDKRDAGDSSELAQEAVDDAFDELETSQIQTARAAKEEDKALAEVDIRIRKANFYRLILENSLFDNGDSVAEEVEAEFRSFATGRLRVLMGMEAETKPTAQAFPPDEIQVLRLWASKLLKKPGIMQVEPPRQATPTLTKPSAQAPTLKPVAAGNMAAGAPKLNQVAAPKRGPGRPPGTGKNQQANKAPAPEGQDIQTDENGRKFVMVERGTDEKGNARFVKVDVTPPVRVEAIKPAPMPSPEQSLMMEVVKADQVPKSSKLNDIINKVQE